MANVERWRQCELIAGGLKSRVAARRTQDYAPAMNMVARIEAMLQKAKRSANK